MTNVMNSTNSTAVTSSVHGSSLSQADDLLPALSSLTFNVTNSGIDVGESGSTAITSPPSGSNSSNNMTVNRIVNHTTIDDSIDTQQLNLLNPILNNNSIDAKDKKSDTNEMHMQHHQQQSHKSSELLTILTSSSASANNGAASSPAMSASQMSLSSYDYTTNTNDSPVSAMWSNVDDGSNHNISSNGFKGSPNYGANPMVNMMNHSNIPSSMHQQHQQQQNRRAITASHGSYQSGLPQNNSLIRGNSMPIQQQTNHHPHNPHKHQPHPATLPPQQQQHGHGMSAAAASGQHGHNMHPVWSNASTAWQPPQQHQSMQQPWNRGRSVPNLNPLTNNMPNNRKPTSPNPGMSMSGYLPSQPPCNMTSPMKYRRSTSFPGKGHNAAHGNVDIGGQGLNNISHGPLDGNAIDDVRDQFMQYQVCN